MYVTRTEVMVQPAAVADFEGFFTRIGEFRKGKPGVIGQTLLRSYQYPGKYALISRWETIEASWSLQRMEDYLQVLKTQPSGGAPSRPQEGFESVFNVDADDLGRAEGFGCEVLHDFDVDVARKAPEFEKNRQRFGEVQKANAKGFGSYRLRRSTGNPLRYMAIAIWRDRQSGIGMPPNAEVERFLTGSSARQYLRAPQTMEAYAVVHRM